MMIRRNGSMCITGIEQTRTQLPTGAFGLSAGGGTAEFKRYVERSLGMHYEA